MKKNREQRGKKKIKVGHPTKCHYPVGGRDNKGTKSIASLSNAPVMDGRAEV